MDNDVADITVKLKSNVKKNIIIVALAIIGIVLIVALFSLGYGMISGGDRLICSSNNDNNGIKIERNNIINYNNDVVSKVVIESKYEYSNQADFNKFKSVIIPGTDSNYSALENDNVTYDSTTKDKTFSFTLNVNLKNLNKEDIEKIGISKSLKEIKTIFESQGLACK